MDVSELAKKLDLSDSKLVVRKAAEIRRLCDVQFDSSVIGVVCPDLFLLSCIIDIPSIRFWSSLFGFLRAKLPNLLFAWKSRPQGSVFFSTDLLLWGSVECPKKLTSDPTILSTTALASSSFLFPFSLFQLSFFKAFYSWNVCFHFLKLFIHEMFGWCF